MGERQIFPGAVKIHTILDLRGSIPVFIHITDGKYHDSNVLDIMVPVPEAIYLMDKAYIDFAALYNIHKAGAFFVSRAKFTMAYMVVEHNYNIDESTGLRGDKTIKLRGRKSKKLYPQILRMVDYYDDDKDVLLVFLTNNHEVSALEIARLYRNRWQIVVFFYAKPIVIQSGTNKTIENQVIPYMLPLLSTCMGHKSIGVTERYVRLTQEMYPELLDDERKFEFTKNCKRNCP